jgi:hypothetical protein
MTMKMAIPVQIESLREGCDMRNAYKTLIRNPKGKTLLRKHRRSIVLKCIFKIGIDYIDCSGGLRQILMAGSSEHGSEILSPLKDVEFHKQLNNYNLLRDYIS